jgi:hypothetical protein
VSPVKYKLGFYVPEDDILHSHCRESIKSYKTFLYFFNATVHISRECIDIVHICLLTINSVIPLFP